MPPEALDILSRFFDFTACNLLSRSKPDWTLNRLGRLNCLTRKIAPDGPMLAFWSSLPNQVDATCLNG
jgi:hypothetical protein